MTSTRPPGCDDGEPPPAGGLSYRCRIRLLNAVIAVACLLAVAALWLITFQRIAFERDQAVAAAMKSNTNLAIAFEQQVFRTLKTAEQIAVFVRDLYMQQGRAVDLRQLANQRTIREAAFSIVSVVGENGDILSSTSLRASSVINYADREFFFAQREPGADTLFISQPVLGRVSGHWQIPMSMRIALPDGSFGGVVVMSVRPAEFTNFYEQADLGQQGLLELGKLDGAVLSRKIGGRNESAQDAAPFAWFSRRQTEPEGGFVDDGQALDGVARIVSYRTLAGYPLMVAVGTSYEDELAAARQREGRYLLMAGSISLALLLFASLLILMLARQRTAVSAVQASEALFRATFHQAAMGIAHIAPDGRIIGANEKLCLMLGYSEEELRARTIFELGDRHDEERVRMQLQQRLSAPLSAFFPEIEKTYRRKDGSILWVCEALSAVTDVNGQARFLVAVTQDITARKELEERLSHAALHDPLTGLPNRLMFMDRFDQVLESARRHGGLAGILYIDLDGFKGVNDRLGHATGDQLLCEVGRRLQNCVRAEDTVARFGGDEFGVVLASLGKAEDCEAVARKIIAALATPFDLAANEASSTVIRVSASVGAAVYPVHGTDIAILLNLADTAMYAAKNAGRNQFTSAPGSQPAQP